MKGYTKRSGGGIAVCLFFVFLLGLSSVLYTDSYAATLEAQRKQTYGAWHVAVYQTSDDVIEAISHHATVQSAGEMDICGYILDEEGTILGGMGTVDDTLVEIGNLTLLDGHFPQTSGEIAVEASYLDALGCSYELGQQLELPILLGIDDEAEVVTKTFTLCGVVKNYSAYWSSETFPLVSFFVSQEQCASMPQLSRHVFAELQETYASEASALAVLAAEAGTFLENDFTYLEYAEQDEQGTERTVLQWVILLAGCLAILILGNNELDRRKNSFTTMRLLGATKGQIVGYFLRGKLPIFLLAMSAGILWGLCLPYLAVLLLRHGFHETVCYKLVGKRVLSMILLYVLGLIVSLSLSLLRVLQTPLRGNLRQQTVKLPRCRKPLGAGNLFAVLGAGVRKERAMSVLLTFVAAVFVLISSYSAWDSYVLYRKYCLDYPEDYSYGLMSYYALSSAMTEQELEQIQNAYGVERVETFSSSDYYALDFPKGWDQDYGTRVYAFLKNIVGDLPDTQLCGAFLGVSDDLLPTYLQEAGAASKDTLADDEIILYLPSFSMDEDGSLEPIFAGNTRDYAEILSEDVISPGDTVSVTIGDSTERLNIVGVLHGQNTRISYDPIRPYSLICNQRTYEKLLGKLEYTYVLVYQDETDIPYQTDVELSKIHTGLYFDNNRVERSEQSRNLAMQLILAMVLSVSGFVVILLIRAGIYASTEESEIQRYGTLHLLGMTRGTMLGSLTKRASLESIWGVLLAFLALLGYRMWQEATQLLEFADYVKPGLRTYCLDAYERVLTDTHWGFAAVMTLLVLLLNLGFLTLHNYRVSNSAQN
jgi:hypothetical protein